MGIRDDTDEAFPREFGQPMSGEYSRSRPHSRPPSRTKRTHFRRQTRCPKPSRRAAGRAGHVTIVSGMPNEKAAKLLGVALRVGVYVLLIAAGMFLFSRLLLIFGNLVASAVGVFLAAVVANALVLRIFDRAHLTAIGLAWNPASVRNLLIGLAGGTGAACVILIGPIVFGLAELQAVAGAEPHWRTMLFVIAILLFGAIGEELLFRGYAFQTLMVYMGPFATILPFGVLFGLAHSSNLAVSNLGLINTTAWGILLGYSFLRSGDLWLPIGLHLGWNWALPLFGVQSQRIRAGRHGVCVALENRNVMERRRLRARRRSSDLRDCGLAVHLLVESAHPKPSSVSRPRALRGGLNALDTRLAVVGGAPSGSTLGRGGPQTDR